MNYGNITVWLVTAASLVQQRKPNPSAPSAATTLSVGFMAPSSGIQAVKKIFTNLDFGPAWEENSVLKVYFIPDIYPLNRLIPRDMP